MAADNVFPQSTVGGFTVGNEKDPFVLILVVFGIGKPFNCLRERRPPTLFPVPFCR